MSRKPALKLAVAAVAALLMLGAARPALAGCCVIVTLDELPAQVIAGQPIHVGFMVRFNHSPARGLTPEIAIRNTDTGETLSVTAQAEGKPGHYAARLTFPSAGKWSWSISGGGAQPMPELTVLAAIPAAAAVAPPWSLLVGLFGLFGVAGALLASRRRRPRFAPALVLAAALVSITGFASAANGAPRPVSQAGAAELGRSLFIAKGCVVCHRHEAVAGVSDWGGIGPDLTNPYFDPAFLRRWLNDPSSVRPGTFMPTLGLNSHEIESLIAFINTK
jgi:cytochrome c2